jgi:plasmid stability protein
MKRTTISLPDDLLKRLRMRAAERGVSMATLVREALEDVATQDRPKPKSLGIFASGHRDTARRSADEVPEPPSWR